MRARKSEARPRRIAWTSFCAALTTVACGNTSSSSSSSGPVTLAWVAGSDRTGDIALDATHVYLTSTASSGCPQSWMFCARSAITKVPLDGGAPISLASGYGSEGIAVDATSVYWADSDSISVGGAGSTTSCPPDAGTCALPPTLGADVMKVPLGGGSATTVAANREYAFAVAVNSTDVYWTSVACPAVGCTGALRTAPTGGGPATTLASLPGKTAGSVVLDATSAYVTSDGVLMKIPLAGGTPAMLAAGPASSLAIAAGTLYWTNECPTSTPLQQCVASLMKMPVAGGAATTLASWKGIPYEPGTGVTPHAIAVDADTVYWTRFGCDEGGCESALLKVPIAGGTPTVLNDGQTIAQPGPGMFPLAVDSTALYWASAECPRSQAPGVCVMKLEMK